MRIAFATIYDLRDIRRGSGTFHSLAKELERQGHVVHYLGPFEKIGFPVLTRAFKSLSVAAGKRYSSWMDPFTGHRLARAVEGKLHLLDYDILLTNDYTIAAYARSRKAVVLYTDNVFPRNYANNADARQVNLSKLAVYFCQRVTSRALNRVALCLFAPRWALQEALKYEGAVEGRMGIIEFGANLSVPDKDVMILRKFARCVQSRSVQLLFVGKDWHRKGGDVAVSTATELNHRGIKARLHIVGSQPPGPVPPDVVVVHGLLHKSDPSDRQKLEALYRSSDVMLLPSRSEGFVIAPQEAAAYALPTLAYRSQGVSDAIRDGVTGVLLPPDAPASAFADIVQSWFETPAIYDDLARGAREYCEQTVNWERAAGRLVAEIQSRLFGKSTMKEGSLDPMRVVTG